MERIPGDHPRRSPEEMMAEKRRAFPGRIAVLCDPPQGATPYFGGEDENGRGFSVHFLYIRPDGRRVLVRTKAAPPPIDPEYPPPFVTIDTLENAFAIHARRGRATRAERDEARREFLDAPTREVEVLIDGGPVRGHRMDLAEYSGVELDWNGQSVQCVGAPADIDALSLCTARESEH